MMELHITNGLQGSWIWAFLASGHRYLVPRHGHRISPPLWRLCPRRTGSRRPGARCCWRRCGSTSRRHSCRHSSSGARRSSSHRRRRVSHGANVSGWLSDCRHPRWRCPRKRFHRRQRHVRQLKSRWSVSVFPGAASASSVAAIEAQAVVLGLMRPSLALGICSNDGLMLVGLHVRAAQTKRHVVRVVRDEPRALLDPDISMLRRPVRRSGSKGTLVVHNIPYQPSAHESKHPHHELEVECSAAKRVFKSKGNT